MDTVSTRLDDFTTKRGQGFTTRRIQTGANSPMSANQSKIISNKINFQIYEKHGQ